MIKPFAPFFLKGRTLPLLLVLCPLARATTYTVRPSQTQSAIQAIINGTSVGDKVVYSPGTYQVSSTYRLKCGVAYSGQPIPGAEPKSLTPSTILNATFSGGASIFTVPAGCVANPTTPTLIEYFWCQNTGCVWADGSTGDIAYLTIRFNKVTNLPSVVGGSDNHMVAFYFPGAITSNAYPGSGYITSNVDFEYNSIGDSYSCTAVFASMADNGGYCGGIGVDQWQIHDWTVKYNYFYHLEEPMHFEQIASYANGVAEAISSCTARCVIQYNYTFYTHRHALEIQFGVQNDSFLIEHNAFVSIFQSTNASFGTSLACCQSGTYQGNGSPSAYNPADIYHDNVVIADLPSGPYWVAPMGLEWWGIGSQASNNLIEGNFGAGIEWGYLTAPAAATYNYVCGNYMANGGVKTPNGPGTFGYIVPEGYSPSYTIVPAQNGNITSSNCGVIASVPPTISITPSGTNPTGVIASLNVAVNKNAIPSGENTAIHYTIDGSTPTTRSRICNVPPATGCSLFVPTGTTVKAVSMWGVPPLPATYPAGYGYVPSKVVTATAMQNPGTRAKLVSAYLKSKGGATAIELGRTLQFIAYGVYSDGSVQVLPDLNGDSVTAWNTSNHAVAKVSTLGHVTAMGVGTVTIEGFIGNLEASTAELKVTPTIVSSVQASVIEPSSEAMIEPLPGSTPAAPGPPIADKFLGPLWKVVTPNGGSASISNGHLFLSVPGGRNHDTLRPMNQAVRAVQQIGDTDFDVSIKIDSPIQASDADTSQGLMVLADDDAFITFALTTDGTNIGLIARTINAGVATTVLEDTNFNQYQNPMYLRLARTGAAYMASYSADGIHWTQATSFTDAGALTFIGPFDSNYNSNPEKAVPVVMSVDWFNVE